MACVCGRKTSPLHATASAAAHARTAVASADWKHCGTVDANTKRLLKKKGGGGLVGPCEAEHEGKKGENEVGMERRKRKTAARRRKAAGGGDREESSLEMKTYAALCQGREQQVHCLQARFPHRTQSRCA